MLAVDFGGLLTLFLLRDFAGRKARTVGSLVLAAFDKALCDSSWPVSKHLDLVASFDFA